MKTVYFFGDGKADGGASDKNLLGGKGANLAEMTSLDIPVPPGFTITTEVCVKYLEDGSYPENLESELNDALSRVESIMDQKFGDADNPLLLSVRSGARQSMPGMMETVLNVGLTQSTIAGLVKKTGNERFVYDAYRRLIMMYSDVVMEKAAGIEPKDEEGIRFQLEELLEEMKAKRGVKLDTELTTDDLKELVEQFKDKVKEVLGTPFPDDARDQLLGGIEAVFRSWNGKRAISYRKIENIPHKWGTAVNVQSMVFGNMGDSSATGVAFTRNPATGENAFYGEWLVNAQGEDVVAGTRTPNPLNEAGKTDDTQELPSLETAMPEVYQQLADIRDRLEEHYKDMQDIEFTIQEGRLWMLQTRTGKRNGVAAIRMAAEMVEEGLIDKQTAIMRVRPNQLDEIMHPMVDPKAELKAGAIAKGLPAGPGGGTGQIVFTADDAEARAKAGKQVILVRNETSPEDVHGMHAAAAILTAKGGMTSHAALVARGWGKCCIVGCSALKINAREKTMTVGGKVLKEGDWITLNGTIGKVYEGQLDLIEPDLATNKHYTILMDIADELRTLNIRTNADRPEDAQQARDFGAQGIGLCRTEHMFFDPERISAMREMIVAENEETRRKAIMKLLPFQRDDFKGILAAMSPYPVTIRLLDPPLHEFVTLDDQQVTELAGDLGISEGKLRDRISSLHELNPMLGHRGCRLGVAYPEITEMQARAIFEATAELTKAGKEVFPEVMVPLVGSVSELSHQKAIINEMAAAVQKETGVDFEYLVGTMIELPRACVTADEIAQEAEFFSFGTNDLTQTTFGFSRDDIGGFLPIYLEGKILEQDPFQSIDQQGVGELVKMGVEKGRRTKSNLKIGVCGEHGGDPDSIDFFHRAGLNYVSCSPYRVPIARLAAAQAAMRNG
ncbi:MAG: pyruvate, phosphate dikinase [Candidatus Marinimicrobia bacterium]|nr:pyruvate, phosphate dikinase [Candidatus Neomarinimicrobiota bacterium]MCF7839872.1 pyruvate, phosphate dikinase [Candidatus Neomarinimicrobiota bacterium]